MIDVNKITSTLAKLPDAMLQKYAQLNKADPYIMALAMSESNRRKAVRSAAPAQQGMQAQPKVVDQMVAEMAPVDAMGNVTGYAEGGYLPEEHGIGRLPTGNMNFANGGIVAFAGGGDVERYNGTQTSLVGEAQRILQKPPYARTPQENAMLEKAGYALQRQKITPDSGVAQTDLFLNNLGPKIRSYFTDGASGLSNEALADRPNTGGVMNERLLRSMGVDPTAPRTAPVQSSPVTGTAPASYDPAANVQKIAQTNAGRITYNEAPKNAEEAALLQRYSPTARAADAAPKPDTGKKITGIGAPAAVPRTAATQPVEAGPQGIDALLANYQRQTDLNIGQARNATAQYAKSLEDEGAAFVEAEKKRIAEKVDPYKGREERLNKREGELEGMGSKYAGLALLQAGAAMMSTPGGIGMALGKGVQVGSERYAAGIEKINAAKEKFAEARERLDDLRINRADMDARDIRDAEKEARLLKRQGKELFYSGAKDELNMKDKQITAMMGVAANALNTDKEIKARKEISGMEIAARERIAQLPQGNERIAMLLGGGDLAKGLAKFTEIQAGKFNPTTAYTDYLSKRKEGDSVLTPQEFVTQIRSIQALMAGAPSVSNKPTGKAFD